MAASTTSTGVAHDISEVLALAAGPGASAGGAQQPGASLGARSIAPVLPPSAPADKKEPPAASGATAPAGSSVAATAARYSEGEVEQLLAALRNRDRTIEQVHGQMAEERAAFDREMREVRKTLQDQAADSRETVQNLATRVESLQFATQHRGMVREQYEAYTAKHASRDVAAAARQGLLEVQKLHDETRKEMLNKTAAAADHVKSMAAMAVASVAKRNVGEELADVRKLLLADHERQMLLLRDRVRAHVASHLRSVFRTDVMPTVVDEVLGATIRERITPGVAADFETQMTSLATAAIDARVGEEERSAAASVGRLVAAQKHLIERVADARVAQSALAEMQSRELEYAEYVSGVRSAAREVSAAHMEDRSRAQRAAIEVETKLVRERQTSAALRNDVRRERAAGGGGALRLELMGEARRRAGLGRRADGAAIAPPIVVDADTALVAGAPPPDPVLAATPDGRHRGAAPRGSPTGSPQELHHSHRGCHALAPGDGNQNHHPSPRQARIAETAAAAEERRRRVAANKARMDAGEAPVPRRASPLARLTESGLAAHTQRVAEVPRAELVRVGLAGPLEAAGSPSRRLQYADASPLARTAAARATHVGGSPGRRERGSSSRSPHRAREEQPPLPTMIVQAVETEAAADAAAAAAPAPRTGASPAPTPRRGTPRGGATGGGGRRSPAAGGGGSGGHFTADEQAVLYEMRRLRRAVS